MFMLTPWLNLVDRLQTSICHPHIGKLRALNSDTCGSIWKHHIMNGPEVAAGRSDCRIFGGVSTTQVYELELLQQLRLHWSQAMRRLDSVISRHPFEMWEAVLQQPSIP